MGITTKAVRVESHIDEVLAELAKKLEPALEAIGLDAASTAAKVAPHDTGRLQNSINWATHEFHGSGGDAPQAVPEKGTVYIGTNVEYAAFQEFGTSRGVHGRHYIQFGVTAHSEDYKRILEEHLKE